MRIAFISDLHTDINAAYPVLETVADRAAQLQADALVVAGDICENPAEAIRQMHVLDGLFAGIVRYVPGNHDLWNKHCPARDIVSIFDDYKKDPLCLNHEGAGCLGKDGLALVGDVGWYDYSFASAGFDEDALDGMSIGGRTWQDKLFNAWTRDNKAAMARSLERLQVQLEKASKASPEPKIIAVTHMLPVPDFLVPPEQGCWGFFNAFLGSSAIERLYMKYPVRFAVCGHVHYRMQVIRDGIRHICPCLGYESEWPLYHLADEDIKTQVADAMQFIDV
jgi:putative phosphoesterase